METITKFSKIRIWYYLFMVTISSLYLREFGSFNFLKRSNIWLKTCFGSCANSARKKWNLELFYRNYSNQSFKHVLLSVNVADPAGPVLEVVIFFWKSYSPAWYCILKLLLQSLHNSDFQIHSKWYFSKSDDNFLYHSSWKAVSAVQSAQNFKVLDISLRAFWDTWIFFISRFRVSFNLCNMWDNFTFKLEQIKHSFTGFATGFFIKLAGKLPM